MEPLSPRAVNIQSKPRAAIKDYGKPISTKEVPKAKDHGIKPPSIVVQPASSKGALSDQYKTGNHLGKGGFAVCYEGELQCKKYKTADRIYAMKVVPAKMNNKKMEDKFRTELQIHAKMHHPNIVEFHRAFTFKDYTYVILELCPNGSVMDLVKKRGCLSLPEVRRLIVQLCGAVKYMHARNVIHRDLKMGNLFLDQDMNLKLGDFGLAAVLVNKEEYEGVWGKNFSRRTTMCGTPNYIAPEILEKAKGGHDHKVDIWAIGVILFAMLTGLPPFQASSQDEIYRKAKDLDYDWPGSAPSSRRCHNDIPSQARDLVACLLKVDAEARPNPDDIVGHEFFSMHNGNAIPLTLDPSCRRQKPHWLLDERPHGDAMDQITPRLELKALARHCGVGHLKGNSKPFKVVGENVNLSLYKECVAEEQNHTSPEVPLPIDMVYMSTRSLKTWPGERASSDKKPAPAAIVKASVDRAPEKPTNEDLLEPIQIARIGQAIQPRRGPYLSHAATLRAAEACPKSTRALPGTTSTVKTATNVKAEGIIPDDRCRRPSRRLLNELPVRTNIHGPDNGNDQARIPSRQSLRVTRSTRNDSSDNAAAADVQKAEARLPEPDITRKESAAKNEARIAANVQEEIEEALLGQKGSRRQKRTRSKQMVYENPSSSVLISPDEVAESLVETAPQDVCSNLRKLYDELEKVLNGKANVAEPTKESLMARYRSVNNRPVILKWVDYSHKFGIGYILNNGTVGSLYNGDHEHSRTCLAVAGAAHHFRRRKLSTYVDKEQIVSANGAPIAFFEDCGAEGFRRVLVSPRKFQTHGTAGNLEEFRLSKDEYDREKRERLCLYDKFTRYMIQSLGTDGCAEMDGAALARGGRNGSAEPVGPFIKFFQRLGNAHVWGFGDGSFQVNFPDHTKLVVSPDGTWLDFYHLPLEAACSLRKGKMLEAASLINRSALRYPTDVMLSGSCQGHNFAQLIIENELDRKLAFFNNVVSIWLQNGGLGRMGRENEMVWTGMTEKCGKLVWVTIGAHGGDEPKYERRAS